MKIKKIRLKNIRSYQDQEITFPEGSLILSGDVGSGKTSVLLAIEYALFGLQPGQKGSNLLRSNEIYGEVSLDFEVNGVPARIERKLKRSSRGVANEYASLMFNGEKFESSVTEIKSKIVSILGYPSEFIKKNNLLYRFTVYTPQEHMKQIILEDPESRLNILRHIFSIDKYKQIRENLHILNTFLKNEGKLFSLEIKDLEEQRSKLLEAMVENEKLKDKLKEPEGYLKKFAENKALLRKELEELESKIEEKNNFEREIDKTKILLSSKRENLKSVILELEGLSKELVSEEEFDEANLLTLSGSLSEEKKLFQEAQSKSISAKTALFSLQKESEELTDKKTRVFSIDVCPTCLQDVSQTHKHNILNDSENKLTNLKRSISSLERELTLLETELSNRNKKISLFEEAIKKLELQKLKIEQSKKYYSRISVLSKQKESFEKDISLLSSHIDSLKENILSFSIFHSKYTKKQQDLEEVIKEERKTELYLAELKKEIEFGARQIHILEKEIIKKEEKKLKFQEITELIDWLSNDFFSLIDFTERNILWRLRNEFSRILKKWFSMLISDNSIDVKIDDSFTPIIIQKDAEMEYDSLSGGERTAIALAYRLALNQTINSFMSRIATKGIIILDEPTEGFSETQIAKMRAILEELKADQIIIVSHEQNMESFVSNIIKIVKSGDVSVVNLEK